MQTKTLKVRVKDKHAPFLRRMARDVNMVWNYLNELSSRAIKERRIFLSAFDMHKYTCGLSKIEGVSIGAATIQQIAAQYAARREQFKKSKLRWRVSERNSPKYSLGWVPFRAESVKYKGGQIQFGREKIGLWDSYGLGDYELRSGSFSEDSRGRWYFNVCVQVEAQQTSGTASVGIDLGLKTAATCSTGQFLVGRRYRALEKKLGQAQRARKKRLTRAIHAKIKNQRKDDQHKFSTMLVKENAAIFVGNVSSKALVKTKMAKSTLDAGWSQLKTMLEYKCQRAGVVFDVVDERYTTQTCSCCGSISQNSPKGRAGLGIREWACGDCGAVHDRDVNAAKNILAAGHCRLVVGIAA